jgi:hypothetical protein
MQTIKYTFHRGHWDEWVRQVYNLYILENILYSIHSGDADQLKAPFWWEDNVDNYLDLIITFPMRCEYGEDFPWEDDDEAYTYVKNGVCEELCDLTKDKFSYELPNDFRKILDNLYNSILDIYTEYLELEMSYKGE